MATFTEAVDTVEAMAAIPCLRGGYACFDDDLNAVGWYHQQDNLGTIWAQVPEDPAHAKRTLWAGIDEHRQGLERMVGYFNEPDGECDRFYGSEYCADRRGLYQGRLNALDVATGEAA